MNSSQSMGDFRQQLRQWVLLRNITISGILALIVIAHHGLKITLPINSLLLIVSLLVLFNLITWVRVARWQSSVYQWEFFVQLLVDILFFTVLLFQTGGASNPFGLIFLIPIIISATVLSSMYTWTLALAAISCYSLLLWNFTPSHEMHDMDNDFGLHVKGMWIGFVFGTLLVSWFVTRIGNTLREQQIELHAAKEQVLRDEQLVALGTLAAGTAHEMGTPLGTMSLIAEELDDANDSEEIRSRVKILRDQISRCKEALANLSACAGNPAALEGNRLPVDEFLKQLLEHWQGRWTNVNLECRLKTDEYAPAIIADRTLEHAITNILDNAAGVSPGSLVFSADWNRQQVVIDILDNGPGLGGDVLQHLGKHPVSSTQEGMGLGLFLAHSVVSRFGGHVSLYNRKEGGIQTRIMLPTENFS